MAQWLAGQTCAYQSWDDLPSAGAATDSLYLVDQGFEGTPWHQRWLTRYGAQVLCPPKRGAYVLWPRWPRRWHVGLRQTVRMVHDRLLTTFRLEQHLLRGLQARLAAKGALHNLCLWNNVQSGRPPFAFADLIGW